MATDDTILTEDSLRGRPDGLGIAVKIPWYRSLWLSSVSDIAVTLDGAPIPAESLRAELGDRSYRIEELAEQSETLWFLQDRLVIVVPQDEPPAAGDEVDVEVSMTVRLPYMQIAPGKYVTNHATNRRALAVR
ncbi:C-glycoside deglycosidase beta subunit domain-containing protein [Actinoplanes sp. CA-142083]|uniref:C-glycoside deglycosidase beta subunit domain-containing protein n=1 Tax=Actinoplanes sp. CA-142083 TaxID=3239903 RepID=UPI003D8E2F6B